MTNTLAGCRAGEPFALADGTVLGLRRLQAADRDGIAALFAGMSPASRRGRFLGPKAALSAAELTYLSDVDHVRHGAVAAIDPRDGSIVGVGRWACPPGRRDVAELAVTVADAWHGCRVGTALARRALQGARAAGVTRLTATVLAENAPALALARHFGFSTAGTAPGLVELEIAALRWEPTERAGTLAG